MPTNTGASGPLQRTSDGPNPRTPRLGMSTAEIVKRARIPLTSPAIEAWPTAEELPLLNLLLQRSSESPVALGPVGSRFALCRAGLLQPTLAFEQLAAVEEPPLPAYISTLIDVAWLIRSEERGDEALLLSQLLLSYRAAFASPDADADWVAVAVLHIQNASHVLRRTPNGQLYGHTCTVANELIRRLRDKGDDEALARGLSAVSQLILQAYGARPGGIQWWAEPAGWRSEVSRGHSTRVQG